MAYDENQGGFQRRTYSGNWKCSKCSTAITELPFEPDPNKFDQLLCRDCFREKRQSFGGSRGGSRPPFRR